MEKSKKPILDTREKSVEIKKFKVITLDTASTPVDMGLDTFDV